MIYASMMCHHRSLNELIQTNDCRTTNFKPLFKRTEYIPKMHGLRDCIIDTDYKQIENINKSVIQKAKENKVFNKNTIDGLLVMAWDGVELTETNKDIDGLPEREHKDEGIRKYIKYLCAMNVGERANIMVASKQLLEVEKVTSKSGKEKTNEIYVVTNMLNHPIETVIKIMHLRWNIENNGFRTMKQQYNLEHIFIGNLNAINYIVQMMFLVFNLKELYMKIRLKEKVKISYLVFKKIFESEIHNTKEMWKLFEPD